MNKKDRVIIAILSIWTFVHIFILYISKKEVINKTENFYPFIWRYNVYGVNHWQTVWDINLNYYDFSEFLVYVVLVWLIFFLNKFINKEK